MPRKAARPGPWSGESGQAQARWPGCTIVYLSDAGVTPYGKMTRAELTAREQEICAALGPALKERGLIFVGIDVIGGKWLTEINVTSPTGIVAIDRFNGTDTPGRIWDAIEARLGR